MTKSFKQMIQAGEVKRADAMKIPLDAIHEEPGFNLRNEGPELEASIRDRFPRAMSFVRPGFDEPEIAAGAPAALPPFAPRGRPSAT